MQKSSVAEVDFGGLDLTLYQVGVPGTQNANQNKVVFDVRPTASKPEIKRAIEQVYDVKVVRVNTLHTKRGKRAIIKLSEADNAEDIYTRLGQM